MPLRGPFMRPLPLTTNNPFITRRLFVFGGILSVLGALWLTIRGISSFLQKSNSPSRPARFDLINHEELSQNRTGLVYRRGVWLVRDDEGWYGLINVCTHLGCSPALDPERKILICPCHGSRFDLKGNVLKGPADRPLKRPFLWMGPEQKIRVDLERLVDSHFRLRT